jgi:hypothetical protein
MTDLRENVHEVLNQIMERLAAAGVDVDAAKRREIKPPRGPLFYRYEIERDGIVLNWQIERISHTSYRVTLELDTMLLYGERSGWDAMRAQAEAGDPGASISLSCYIVHGDPNQWGRMESVGEPEYANHEDVNPALREFVSRYGWHDEEGLNTEEWQACVDAMAEFFLGRTN